MCLSEITSMLDDLKCDFFILFLQDLLNFKYKSV